MNNKIFFLRHAETKVDSDTPISKWVLTEEGAKQAEELAKSDVFDEIDIIISSDEDKAFLTAKPIAEKHRKDVIRLPELNEIHRDDGGHLSKEEYEKTVKECLKHVYTSINHWEPAHNALERFSKKVEEIDTAHDDKNILIVSHGTVLNLYFAKLLDKLDHVFERWQKKSFCGWGVMQNNKVVKDIIQD